MQNKTKKHPPIKRAPLRQAGQSLQERIDEILYGKVLSRFVIVSCCFYLAFYQWYITHMNLHLNPWSWVVVGLILALIFAKKTLNDFKTVKNLYLGMSGEKTVGESLDRLRGNGYSVFHDLINERGNIDHIIVGPAGVFTVETKTASKTKGDQRISYDGKNLKIDGLIPDKDYLAQANGERAWLENFIVQKIGKTMDIKVKAAIVYPGWYIDQSCNQADVLVFNENNLQASIPRMKAVLNNEKIDIISNLIGSYIRDYEEAL